jgi:hypothetical protein
MTNIASVTWDRFSVFVCAMYSVVIVFLLVVLITEGLYLNFFDDWIRVFSAFGVPYWITMTVAICGALFLAVRYALKSRPKLVFTDSGISGLTGTQLIAFSEFEKWRIRGSILLLWPVTGVVKRPLPPAMRPGTGAGAIWAALDPDKVTEIAELLTAKIEPAQE